MMIRETLNYLRVNVVKERIQKPIDDEHSVKVFNYPYQALEEAVVNALYHRDYMQREPVEITVEPDKISILSYSGPDRSISMEDINEARALRSRRYRNRRLGDFLKELNLTEGRATGIPTIQKKLSENGSPKAVIKTDEARTFFLIIIPCRTDFVQVDVKDENVDIQGVVLKMSKSCPSHVQVMSKLQLENLAICLLRSVKEVSAQEMLEGLEEVSIKHLKRKYLDKLLAMGAVVMTIPEKPTSSKQKYILSELGKELIGR